jgi:hypothetical protein
MLQIIKKAKAVKALALGALFTTFISFSTRMGGEGFEIYLNHKLVLQQYGNQMNNVKSLQLDQSSYNAELTIRYHHCGKVGKDRTITIKDAQNKVLKQWHFTNTTDASNAMTCKVKDILDLQKKNGRTIINLFYSSSELPKGRLLTSITKGNNNTVKL